MLTRWLFAFSLTIGSFGTSHADVVENSGPLPLEPCPQSTVERWRSAKAHELPAILDEIAECAHTTAFHLHSYLYDFVQENDRPEEFLQAVITLSSLIIRDPYRSELCFRAFNLVPKNEYGEWFDTVALMKEIVSRMRPADVPQLRKCMEKSD
jgi:hypothetical protein